MQVKGGIWSGNFDPTIPFHVNRMSIIVKKKLAEGGYAFVFLAEDVETGTPCIVKKTLITTPHARHSSSTELSILRRISHPNIIQLFDNVTLTTESLLVLEYCPGGSLLDLLQNAQAQGDAQLGERTAITIFKDVALAVQYLHKEGFVHRDLKLENILRSRNGVWKLCDFGSSVQGNVDVGTGLQRVNEEEVIQQTTTQMYRAPEMVDLFMSKELTSMVDIWALGCILYVLCLLRHPFETSSNLAIINSKIKFPKSVSSSKQVQELILRMLTAEPTCRATADEVVACTKALMMGCPLPVRACPKPQRDIDRGEDIGSPQLGLGPTRQRRTLCGVGKEEIRSRQSRKQATDTELHPSSVAARRLREREEKNEVEDGEFDQFASDLLLSMDNNEIFSPPPAWTVNDNTASAASIASDPSMVFKTAATQLQPFQDYKIVKNNPCPEVQGKLECVSVPSTPLKQCVAVHRAPQSEGHQMQVGSGPTYYPSPAFEPLQLYSTKFIESGVTSNVNHHETIANSTCGTNVHNRNCLAYTTPEPVRYDSMLLPAQPGSSSMAHHASTLPAQPGLLQGQQPGLMPAQFGSLPAQCNPIAAYHVSTDDNLCSNNTNNTLRGGDQNRPVSLPCNYRMQPVVFSSLPCGKQVTHQSPNSSRAACISMMNATIAREQPWPPGNKFQ